MRRFECKREIAATGERCLAMTLRSTKGFQRFSLCAFVSLVVKNYTVSMKVCSTRLKITVPRKTTIDMKIKLYKR